MLIIFLGVPFNPSNNSLWWEVVSCLSDEEAEVQKVDVSDPGSQNK